MTTLRPTHEAGRLLCYLADLPEGATVEQLASHLYRLPVHPPIRGTYAEKAAARRAWQDAATAAHTASCQRVAKLVRRLARSGLVERQGPPRLAGWVADRVERIDGDREIALGSVLRRAGCSGAEARMAARIVAESPPTRAALGLSGAGERVYDRLVEAGIIVAPSLRRLTLDGVELVEKWHNNVEKT